MRRQRLNVFRMRLLGAKVAGVSSGSRTLKDAISEAMRDWVANVGDTYYLLGSALGSHPYPMMVRDFQKIIGEEARGQILKSAGRLPDAIYACVGGGSNAIGIFHAFVPDAGVELIGVEAGGRGDGPGQHAARFRGGSPGVLQGAFSYLLQDEDGQVSSTHSVSAGLDYAMIGPEHAWLHDLSRAEYVAASDEEALAAAKLLSRTEGHHPRARIRARGRRGREARPGSRRQDLPGERFRPRRQGHRYLPRELQGAGRGMTRIGRLFECLKREKRKGLIAYITAGDPHPDRTPSLVDALVRGGAELIELGVPFSDPVADGPVIQRAGDRAIAAGTNLARVLEIASKIRERSDVPLLLFTYLNPVLRYGLERLAHDAAKSGIDGCLLTDASVEEAEAYVAAMRAAGLDTVFLAAPTSTERRLRLIARYSSGFVYLVSRTGVTGEQESLSGAVAPLVQSVRAVTELPLAVGFGVSKPEHVTELGRQVEAVVVGSAFMRIIESSAGAPELEGRLEAFARELKLGFRETA